MNRTLFTVVTLAIGCSMTTTMARAQFEAPTSATTPSIQVSGTATVNVVPDRVVIRVGVEVYSSKLESARTDHDERVRKILNAARELGIDSKDVQTTHASVYPDYSQDSASFFRFGQRRGFRIAKNIGVTLRDSQKLDALVNRALEAGATSIDSVSFECSLLEMHRQSARRQAAAAARSKADEIAMVMGAKVGRPIRISEETGYERVQGNYYYEARTSLAGQPNKDAQMLRPNGDTTYALGQIEVTAMVAATFELAQ